MPQAAPGPRLSSGGRGKDPREYLRGEGRNNAARECGDVDLNTLLNIFDALMIAQGTLEPSQRAHQSAAVEKLSQIGLCNLD